MNIEFSPQMEVEAIARMELMELFPEAIWEFSEEGRIVTRSEKDGRLYDLTDEEWEMVDRYEEDTGNLVYHIIKTDVKSVGTMYDILFVRRDSSDWQLEKTEIRIGKTEGYEPRFNRTAFIGIKPVAGGIVRTW